MSDRWTHRLSEYLDDELAAADRAALEAHLPGCPDCSATLADLRGVLARARSLDDRPPVNDLWPGIAGRIGVARRRTGRVFQFPRVVLPVPQLAAAVLALMVGTGAAVGLWMKRAPQAVAVDRGAAPTPFRPATAGFGGARYDSAVVDLQRALEAGRGMLDSTTVRVMEENLAIVDQAIEQARLALAADPASVYLNNHLAHTLKRKVELLQRLAQLTAVRS